MQHLCTAIRSQRRTRGERRSRAHRTVIRALATAVLALGACAARASDGWTYTVIASSPANSSVEYPYVSLRDNGEVVYSTDEPGVGGRIRTMHAWLNGIDRTVFSQLSNRGDRITAHISPTGRITFVGACTPATSATRGVCEVVNGVAQTLQPLSFERQATGDMNSVGQNAYMVATQGPVCGLRIDANGDAYRGESDLAIEWLERAYAQRDPGLIEIHTEPLFKGIADDPRFKAFLRKMNLPEENHVLWASGS